MDQADQQTDRGDRLSLLHRPVPVPWQIGAGIVLAAIALMAVRLPGWPEAATWRLMPVNLLAVTVAAAGAGTYAGLAATIVILLFYLQRFAVIPATPVVHDLAWLPLLAVVTLGIAVTTGWLRRSLGRLEHELDGTRTMLQGANRRLAAALESERLRSYYDHLTDLPSRRMVIDRFSQIVSQARRSDSLLALLLLDLNRFKEVNDSVGHDAGDEMLRQIGQRLAGVMRREDTVGRLDSDTFVVLLTGITEVGGVTTAAQKVADALEEPFTAGTPPREIFISASLGAAIYPQDGQRLGKPVPLRGRGDVAGQAAGLNARTTLMRLPPALLPLRHQTFRRLWLASVIAWLGTWLQNTGAGWLMTILVPDPLIVAMVQAATIMPVFLLALPGGALADIVDRRVFLIGTQTWTILAASVLALLTLAGGMTASWLLILTFAIGIGSALTAPAWSAIVPELVPREDLVQAIALNGIGFNLTRAVGPALAGFLILLGGTSLAFSLYACSIVAVIIALVFWKRGRRFTGMPREHLISAMRAGVRFVRHTPAIQSAMVRTFAYSVPSAAPWALLPLFVHDRLGLGAGMYGVILGCMGIGGVTSGMLLPNLRALPEPRQHGGAVHLVVLRRHDAAGPVASLDAGRAGDAAVRAGLDVGLRNNPGGGAACLSALGAGTVAGDLSAGAERRADAGLLRLGLVRRPGRAGGNAADCRGRRAGDGLRGARFSVDEGRPATFINEAPSVPPSVAEAPAPELVPLLRRTRGRIMETMHYRVDPAKRAEFLATMAAVRQVRRRAGANFWQLYDDVAHPEGWMELWSMESWTDHLREMARLSEEDRATLARVNAYRCEQRPARYIAVDPH